jgi:hypothetical protein
MKIMNTVALLSVISASALGFNGADIESDVEDFPTIEELNFESASTPFNLTYKYRFSACNARQGAVARSSWIMDRAFEAGEISEAEYNSDQFRNDVARFIRGFCSNKR